MKNILHRFGNKIRNDGNYIRNIILLLFVGGLITFTALLNGKKVDFRISALYSGVCSADSQCGSCALCNAGTCVTGASVTARCAAGSHCDASGNTCILNDAGVCSHGDCGAIYGGGSCGYLSGSNVCAPAGVCQNTVSSTCGGVYYPNHGCTTPTSCASGWNSGASNMPANTSATTYISCFPTCACCANSYTPGCWKGFANGICGSAAGTWLSSAPTGTAACSSGSITSAAVDSGTGLWSWTCSGDAGGGTSTQCSAHEDCSRYNASDSCYQPYTVGQSLCGGFNQVVGTEYWSYNGPGTNLNLCSGVRAGYGSHLCCSKTITPCTCNSGFSISITSCGVGSSLVQQNSTDSNCATGGVKCGQCVAYPNCSCSPSCNSYTSSGANCATVACPATQTCNSCQKCSGTGSTAGSCVADSTKNVNGSAGVCSGAAGTSSCTAPSASCSVGSASGVSGTGPWSWTCVGTAGVCGGSFGSNATCNVGYISAVIGTWSAWGAWGACGAACGPSTQFSYRSCPAAVCGSQICSPVGVNTGSQNQACNLGCCPVNGSNGVCGSANGVLTGTTPSVNLCSSGASSAVNAGVSYLWTCYGTTGSCGGISGGDATCGAPRLQPPTYTSFEIRNNSDVVVPAESGNINHVCQSIFAGRQVRYVVIATDLNGNSDISSVQLRVGGQTYTNNYSGNFTGAAVFNVTYPAVVSSTTTIIEANITDTAALSTGWVNVGRSFKIWDCKVPVSGTLYDGSKAVFEVINCAAGSQDFTTPISSSNSYNLTFNGIALDTDKVMTVSSPNYGSAGNSLYWGAQYRSNFANLDGNTPVMRYPGTNTCNNTNASFVVDNSGQFNVNPYAANPTLVLNFSSILSQFSWFQAAGGGVVAKNSITDNIPNTCLDLCKPNISLNAGTTAPNGIVAARTIVKGSGSFGETNNWSVNKNVIGTDYSYKYFYNEYYTKLGQGRTYDVGATGVANFSQIVADTGGTGVVFVRGNVAIDTNNTVPSGKFFMLVVSNDININPSVTNIQGIFITDNSFASTGTSDLQLRIDGSVYSKNDVKLARGFTTGTLNNRNPAVLVTYRPDFIFSMPGKLTKILSGWKEGI